MAATVDESHRRLGARKGRSRVWNYDATAVDDLMTCTAYGAQTAGVVGSLNRVRRQHNERGQVKVKNQDDGWRC